MGTKYGKFQFIPNMFPQDVTLYYTGCGDHLTNGRGKGELFQIVSTQAEDKFLEFSFNDWVYIAGGFIRWEGAVIGDHVSMELHAPATPVALATPGQGNCTVVTAMGSPVPILIVPGNTHSLNGADGVPIPALSPEEETFTGFWEWSEPDEGRGVVNGGAPGTSKFHLFAVPLLLARFASCIPLMGDGNLAMMLPSIKPKMVLPHWKFRVTLHNSSAKTIKLAWGLTSARMKTV